MENSRGRRYFGGSRTTSICVSSKMNRSPPITYASAWATFHERESSAPCGKAHFQLVYGARDICQWTTISRGGTFGHAHRGCSRNRAHEVGSQPGGAKDDNNISDIADEACVAYMQFRPPDLYPLLSALKRVHRKLTGTPQQSGAQPP